MSFANLQVEATISRIFCLLYQNHQIYEFLRSRFLFIRKQHADRDQESNHQLSNRIKVQKWVTNIVT